MDYELSKISSVERLDDFSDEYVYDVIMEDSTTPYFFCNGVLVHNSCYYKTFADNKEDAIAIADEIAELTNATFPEFMRRAFNCQPGYDVLIQAGREIVGSRGLFQAKKKYVIRVVDVEGKPVDKLKSQGSEIKKADTPRVIQLFLTEVINKILNGDDYDTLATFVNEQRDAVLSKTTDIFALGVAKQVNNLDKYTEEFNVPGTHKNKNGGKLTIPGHARAACNYNMMLHQCDPGSKPIRSGDKVFIFYLRVNPHKFKAFAVPAESSRFPDWFADHFKVDRKKTEDRMFDSKLIGIFAAAYGREVPTHQSVLTNSLLEF